ncbi:MAG: hypothetical protein JO024_04005 [Candidatus Eremiobacteraeota bacterium]|nr:hypothetical protein [Candidatus Eremiobacteraeota bacterium]MBV9736646.1 hypothetical protein [Candidatus Eremiobacteraeota bacterium]
MPGVRLEIGFLIVFVALFVVVLTLLNALLLPRHYNPIVVLVLASIVVGLMTIFLRYLFFVRRLRK